MADRKLTELGSASLPLDSTDLFYIVQQVTSTATSRSITFVDLSGQMGGGSGDVVGPASATSGNLAVFDGTTGKLIKDGGSPSGGAADPIVTMTLVDDFYNGDPTTSGSVGLYRWNLTNMTGVTGSLALAQTNHPGIFGSNVGSGATGRMRINLSDAVVPFLPSETFDMTWVIQPTNLNTITGVTYRIGAAADNSDPSADGIYFERLGTDTNWFAVTRASSSETRHDMGVTVAVNTWYKLRIRRIDASTLGFQIDGGSEFTQTLTIPTAQLDVQMQVIAPSDGLNHITHVDLFELTVSGLTR